MDSLIKLLKDRLGEALPGVEAQYKMAPITRPKFDLARLEPGTYRKSAVTLLLCPFNDSFRIPLIKRYEYKGKHSNQIGLPGGKQDEVDKTLERTALRELKEEIGIAEDHVEILGALTPVYIPVSSFYVQPYVALYKKESISFSIDDREVKQLMFLDTELLKKDRIVKEGGIVSGDGYKLKTPYFEIEGEMIWGATAMILNEFKTLIT
jgi:8-oxo-dGTP pyrophosphatase MutT (NUDIX family)